MGNIGTHQDQVAFCKGGHIVAYNALAETFHDQDQFTELMKVQWIAQKFLIDQFDMDCLFAGWSKLNKLRFG
ncbi:hypothetical protein D3C81_652420 [compost metagenome]